MAQSPRCLFVDQYPALQSISADARSSWVAQVEAGIPLTSGQLASLGYASHLQGVVLLPQQAKAASKAQFDGLFPPNARRTLSDILELALEVRDERSA